MGVYLFFIISGIVISQSMDSAKSLATFGLRRLARLWPPMLVVATATFAITSFLGPPELIRSAAEYLISMTFVFPGHIGAVLGYADWQWLDGAYWSLWVEVRFYVVAGLIWFTLKDRRLEAWAVFALLSALVFGLGHTEIGIAYPLSRALFAYEQPFLTIGIALAALRIGYKPRLARALLVGAFVQAILYISYHAIYVSKGQPHIVETLIGLCIVLVLPTLAVLAPGRIRWVGILPLRNIGKASYTYYLMHQNIGISLLVATTLTGWVAVVAMIAIQAILLAVAFGLYRWLERPVSALVHRRTA